MSRMAKEPSSGISPDGFDAEWFLRADGDDRGVTGLDEVRVLLGDLAACGLIFGSIDSMVHATCAVWAWKTGV